MTAPVETGIVTALAVAGGLALLVAVAIYVWYALALSRLFPRLDSEGWKGWVPVLNEAEILARGGVPAWSVVFYFIPVVQLYGIYLKVVATHRINKRFGRGAGMTVLAILLPPVWASVLAWGAPPYPETDRLAAIQPGPRRAGQPAAAPARDASGYTIPSLSPAAGDRIETAGAAASFPAPPSPVPVAHPPAEEVPAQPSVWGAPSLTAAQTPVPAPSASSPHAAAPSASPAHSFAPPPPAFAPQPPAVAPAVAPVPAVAEPSAPAPAAAEPRTAVEPPAPAPAAVEPPAPSAAPGEAGQASAPRTGIMAAMSGDVEPAPAAEVPADPAPAAVRPAPPVFGGDAGEGRAPEAPGIRPAPGVAPAADVAPALAPHVAAVPTADMPQVGLPDAVDKTVVSPRPTDDDLDATVVVARRRGVQRVLVLDDGRRFTLSGASVVIGRNPDGAPGEQRLAISDGTRTLSKTHARLVVDGDEWRLTDLNSTNGVVVVEDDGSETLLDAGETVVGTGRFVLGEVGMQVVAEKAS